MKFALLGFTAAFALPLSSHADTINVPPDGADLARVLGSWAISDENADVNGDGIVDGTDLAMILGEWNTLCSD